MVVVFTLTGDVARNPVNFINVESCDLFFFPLVLLKNCRCLQKFLKPAPLETYALRFVDTSRCKHPCENFSMSPPLLSVPAISTPPSEIPVHGNSLQDYHIANHHSMCEQCLIIVKLMYSNCGAK